MPGRSTDSADARGAPARPTRLGDERTEISWQLAQAGIDTDSEAALPPDAHPLPSRIGPYRIVEELGQGGMGAVYLAEQTEPIRRRVAIKLIHPELLSRSALLRFDAERQALARMQHPNIAQIFEAGTTQEGHPFVVMEALEGEPLTTYCDRRQLTIRQRLDLFRQVCAGVQHAHQKGVLHRDLKPNNVLVVEDEAGKPQVKLIDFGIAKALNDPLVDATQLTGAHLLGTPAYLSPEAIDTPDQGADVRSDVYALGILLYELLSGGRPFEVGSQSRVEFLWRIVNEEPRRPSQRLASWPEETQERVAGNRGLHPAALLRSLRRDLDWLALRAIAKLRDDRYPSVSALDADIYRYLHHQPLQAASPSRTDHFLKWLRRNRNLAAAALVVLLTLVGGIVARTLEAERANREAAAARQAEEESRQVIRFLTRMFNQADPRRSVQGEPVSAREVLDWGIETIAQPDLVERPAVRVKLLSILASVLISLGDAEQARALAQEAVTVVETRLGGMQPAYAPLLANLALAEARLGRPSEAEAAFVRGRDVLELAGPSAELGSLLMNLGTFYAQQGRLQDAESNFRRGLDMWSDDGNELEPPINQARHLSNYGGVLASAGKFEEAEAVLYRARDYARRHLGPSHPLLAYAILNLGNVLRDQERFEEAVPQYREGLELLETSVGVESPALAGALRNLAATLDQLQRPEEAEPLHRRALALREEHLGPDHPMTLQTRFSLAFSLAQSGRMQEALELSDGKLERLQASLGTDHPAVADAAAQLCGFHRRVGDLQRALELCRYAVDVQGRVPGGDAASLADLWRELAKVQAEAGDAAAQQESLRQAEALAPSAAP